MSDAITVAAALASLPGAGVTEAEFDSITSYSDDPDFRAELKRCYFSALRKGKGCTK